MNVLDLSQCRWASAELKDLVPEVAKIEASLAAKTGSAF